MSYLTCIVCDAMVNAYEKYCPQCLIRYNVLQDTEFWKTRTGKLSTQEVRNEVQRDCALKMGLDSMPKRECAPSDECDSKTLTDVDYGVLELREMTARLRHKNKNLRRKRLKRRNDP